MAHLQIPKRVSKSFDLLRLPYPVQTGETTSIVAPDSVQLIEIKSTKKKLPNLPYGFFFGATANEFALADLVGDKFRFCFVSFHPESRKYVLLTTTELDAIVRRKRVQFQITIAVRPPTE